MDDLGVPLFLETLVAAKTAQENMLYSDWNDCMQGDINRDLVAAKARPKLLAFVSLPTSLKNPLFLRAL